MLQFLLFETGPGRWLLCWFERLTGLAIVPADMLAEMPSGYVH